MCASVSSAVVDECCVCILLVMYPPLCPEKLFSMVFLRSSVSRVFFQYVCLLEAPASRETLYHGFCQKHLRVNSGLDLPCAAELKQEGSTMMYYGLNYVPRRPCDASSAVAGNSHPDPAQVLTRRQQGQAPFDYPPVRVTAPTRRLTTRARCLTTPTRRLTTRARRLTTPTCRLTTWAFISTTP